MGECCSSCFVKRGKEVRFYIPPSDDWSDTTEPKVIDINDEKVTSGHNPFRKDKRSIMQDKVSWTKISEAATPTNGKSVRVHSQEDSKKSSSTELGLILPKKRIISGAFSTEDNKMEIINEDEEKMDTLFPESKTNQQKKGQHLKSDIEFIHQMLYSSDSSDSFEYYQEERPNML